MASLEIVLQRENEAGWPVVMNEARQVEMDVRSEGTLALNLEDLDRCQTPAAYGDFLGKALFSGSMLRGFTQALTNAKKAGEPLRVLLTIEDRELKGLKWERLHAPFGPDWDYLALREETPFSHYLPSLVDRRFPPIGSRDLKVLLLVAGPAELARDYNLEDFGVEKAINAVRAGLGDKACDVLANSPDGKGSPDLDTLCEFIKTGGYTILHLVCHGKYSPKSGETALYFPRSQKDRTFVTASELVKALGRLTPERGLPQFTFLMACESGVPDAEKNFGGAGQRLVRDLGTPAVLAMTAPVKISTANALAAAFYPRLFKHGEPDRALAEALNRLQEEKVEITVPVILSRLGDKPLFSDSSSRSLTPTEIINGILELRKLIPVYAPMLDEEAAQPVERLEKLADRSGLDPANQIRHDQALLQVSGLCSEILEMSFKELAVGRTPKEYQAECPFPGLAAFQVKDSKFFFGREKLTNTLEERLKENTFLTVLGASGSGKSSLVRAGLAPRFQKPLILTPGSDPGARLAAELDGNSEFDLLVIDQFEEVFTLCRSEEERKKFIAGVTSQTRPVVITMRADFIGECAPYPALRERVQKHSELIAPMSPVELREVVERQAEAAGLRFEADVADDIVEDLKNEPGAMPLLQHALLQLWQRRRGRWLRLADYRDGGGVLHSIAVTADEIFLKRLENDYERARMRAIFTRLTRLAEDAPETSGGQRRDTRRRVMLDELVPAGKPLDETRSLINRLGDARLVVTSLNPSTQQVEVEVAHEALIRHWPTLGKWLDEDRPWLRLGESVRLQALEWEQDNRNEERLVHRGTRLANAIEMGDEGRYTFNQREADYLSACQSLIERQRKAVEQRRRITIAASVIAAVLMAGLAIWGFAQAEQARVAQSSAEQQSNINLGRQLALQSRDAIDVDLNAAILLGVEAMRCNPGSGSAQAIMAGLDMLPASQGGKNFQILNSPILLANRYFLLIKDDQQNILYDIRQGREIPLAGAQQDAVEAALSPDGRRLVLSGQQGPQLFELPSGRLLDRAWPKEMEDAIQNMFFGMLSSDGSKLLTEQTFDSIQVWDLETGQKLLDLPADGEIVHLNRDGSRLAVRLDLIDTVSGKKLYTAGGDLMSDAAFSEDGRRLFILSVQQERVTVWVVDAGTGEEIQRILLPLSYRGDGINFNLLAVTPDGRYFAIGGPDSLIYLWDSSSGDLLWSVANPAPAVSLTFSPDGSSLLATSEGGILTIRETTTGQETERIMFSGDIESAGFTYDAQHGYVSTYGGLEFWEIPNQPAYRVQDLDVNQPLWSLAESLNLTENRPRSARFSPDQLVFSPDGSQIAFSTINDGLAIVRMDLLTGEFSGVSGLDGVSFPYYPQVRPYVTLFPETEDGEDQQLHLVSTFSGEESRILQPEQHIRLDADISLNGSRAVSLLEDGSAWVWDPRTGKSAAFASTQGQGVIPGSFEQALITPDGKRVLTLKTDEVALWDASTGILIQTTSLPGYFLGFGKFSPDLRYGIITNDLQTGSSVFDLTSGTALYDLPFNSFSGSGVFSNDSSMIAVTDMGSGSVQVFETGTGKSRFQARHHSVEFAAISGDNRWVISSGGSDVRVWEIETGNEMARMSHSSAIMGTALSSDGRLAASLSDDGDLRVWLWQPQDLIEQACAQVKRNLTRSEWMQYVGASVDYSLTCPNLPEPAEPTPPAQEPDAETGPVPPPPAPEE